MTLRTEINGESTSMVWPTLGSRTDKEQNRTEQKQQSDLHHVPKNGDSRLIAVTPLSNLIRFLKFVNRQIFQEICKKAITEDHITPCIYYKLPYVVLPDSSPSDCVTKGEMRDRPRPCCFYAICNISSTQFNWILLKAKWVETATCITRSHGSVRVL